MSITRSIFNYRNRIRHANIMSNVYAIIHFTCNCLRTLWNITSSYTTTVRPPIEDIRNFVIQSKFQMIAWFDKNANKQKNEEKENISEKLLQFPYAFTWQIHKKKLTIIFQKSKICGTHLSDNEMLHRFPRPVCRATTDIRSFG